MATTKGPASPRLVAALVTVTSATWMMPARAGGDALLLMPGAIPVRVSAYSPFAEFKQRLAMRLARCALAPRPGGEDKTLEIGQATREQIAQLSSCDHELGLPVGSFAYRGAITVALWRALLPHRTVPTLMDRIDSLTLTFEATDFSDPPEWNFCQDNAGPPAERLRTARAGTCYNAVDPCSMLTWGPRGATAGQGAEIQWVLWRLARQSLSLLAAAFGEEFPQVLRFVRMRRPPATSCDGSSALEHFMCAVWLDDKRRERWTEGLKFLGGSQDARRAYETLYASREFDGYKMDEYGEMWLQAGIKASELDFAYFFDRATHIGSPPAKGSPERLGFERCLLSEAMAGTRNAAARRCLSLAQPHPTQPVDRLGRDVAYYRGAYPIAALSEREMATWQRHIPIDAHENFGLMDDRPAPQAALASRPLQPDDHPPESVDQLTDVERACPAEIRNPLRRAP